MTIVTVCYGTKKRFNGKKNAISFYSEAAMGCEGSERERYENVLCKIYAGFVIADDTDDWNPAHQLLSLRSAR